jgi:murein DD-endopeptidase MepM/ murein hydrolase activator NlpD
MKFVLSENGMVEEGSLFSQPAVEVSSPTGTITSGFGSLDEVHTSPHTGIDFAVPEGTELEAPLDGVVSMVKDYGDASLGKAVFVKMEDGQQYVLGHLSEIKVEIGDRLQAGDLIGLSGNTGLSTGPHLHFGVYDTNGLPTDPGNVMFEAFQGQPELVNLTPNNPDVSIPSDWLAANKAPDAETSSWVAEKLTDGAQFILEPIGDAFAQGIHFLFISALQYAPLVLTIGGMTLFMLTMASGKGKFYGYGLTCWGLSAIVRVISHGFGI